MRNQHFTEDTYASYRRLEAEIKLENGQEITLQDWLYLDPATRGPAPE